jgi:hypothetical protein
MFLSKLILTGQNYTRETLPADFPGGWEEFIQMETDSMKMPYLILAVLLIILAVVFALYKLPDIDKEESHGEKGKLINFSVLKRKHLRWGVIAQFFYNGGQTAINSLFLVYCCMYAGLPEDEATTKNESLTLYKGETYTWYLTGVKSLSSASSTKKAVATVKANKSKKQYTISAKKAGTSVVTIKGKDYYGHTQSLKIKVTVAEPKFDLKLQKLDGNYILIRVKNNTKATFDRLAVRYSLKNSSGSEVAAKDEIVYRVMSGKTAYESIYVSSAADVDISQSSVKITAFDRNPEQKYKVLGKDKLSVTVTDEQVSDSSISFKLKKVNKTSQYVYGEIYIISYDANGTIIDVSTSSLYLDKKETKTTSETVSKSPYSHPNFDHYEIVYGGYYTKK